MRKKVGGSNFVTRYEKALKTFEKDLKRQVSDFLDKNGGETTTHDLVVFLLKKNSVFHQLYEANYNKAWYKLRKTLLSLRLKKQISMGRTEKISFPNYKWRRI